MRKSDPGANKVSDGAAIILFNETDAEDESTKIVLVSDPFGSGPEEFRVHHHLSSPGRKGDADRPTWDTLLNILIIINCVH